MHGRQKPLRVGVLSFGVLTYWRVERLRSRPIGRQFYPKARRSLAAPLEPTLTTGSAVAPAVTHSVAANLR